MCKVPHREALQAKMMRLMAVWDLRILLWQLERAPN